MRSEKRPAQVRRVYTPQGENIERLVVRYLASRDGGHGAGKKRAVRNTVSAPLFISAFRARTGTARKATAWQTSGPF